MSRTLEELGRARWSWFVVLLLLAIHAWVEWQGGYQEVSGLYEKAGLSSESWQQGNYASLLTYALLHGSWVHYSCNALLLLFLGARVENLLGGKRLVFLLLCGTLLGGFFHILMSGESSALLVGSSGAAMALLLTVTTLSPQSRMFPLPLSAGNVGLGILISSFLLMLLDPASPIPLFAGWGKELASRWGGDLFRIGHACHFGGALVGLLMGRWILRRPVTLTELQAQRERREKTEA